MNPTLRAAACAVVAAFTLAFAVTTASQAQTQDLKLKVGVLPIVDVAPLYLGMQKGFFKDEHLSIEPAVAQGGADVVQAVLSGDEQFGYGNVVSQILAVGRGLPLLAVTDGSQSIADGKHQNTYLVVNTDSPIKTLKDVEGKTIGVNALNTISQIMIKDDLERHGVNLATVKWVEIPFPAMAPAVKQGRIDVGLMVEPFLTAVKGEYRPILEPFDDWAKHITLATYFTAKSYAAANPDVVARFKRAMLRSLAYASANPSEVRAIIPTYTKIDADTASKMALVAWGTQIDLGSIAELQKSLIKQGLMKDEIDLKSVFPVAGGK